MGALSIGFCFLVALSPFALWFYKLAQLQDIERFVRYLVDQVAKSMATNRGEIEHPMSGDRLFFLKILATKAAFGSFLFLGASSLYLFRLSFLKRPKSLVLDRSMKAWFFNALAFILSFAVPFSFVSYQLPHYLHPIYLLMLLPASVYVGSRLSSSAGYAKAPMLKIRWSLLLVLAVGTPLYFYGPSKTENRGQQFIEVAKLINAAPSACKVLIPTKAIDAYSAEAFALWYFQNRAWSFVDREYPAEIAIPDGSIYWDPRKKKLWGRGLCQI
jgi:hypothetical protein